MDDGTRLPGQHALDHQVIRDGDGRPELVASRCPRCGDVRFPGRELCVNDLERCEEIALSREGVIYEAVRVDVAPVGFEPPYWTVYADFPEGVRIFAPLRWQEEREPRQGDRVEYDIEIVRTEPYEVRGPLLRPSTIVNPAGSTT